VKKVLGSIADATVMAWLHDLFLLLPASRAFPVGRLLCSGGGSFPRQLGHFPDGIVLLLARDL